MRYEVVGEKVHVRVREHGPLFTLRAGWTLERVQEGIESAAVHRPFLCAIKHRYEVIGDMYYEPDDVVGTAMSFIAGQIWDRLVRCKRCGAVATRARL